MTQDGDDAISLDDAELTEDDMERGRLLFSQSCEFVKSVAALDGLPEADRVEIAFAGRSNVGKSSLLNALTGRKSLARTSNTPGRTQLLNFFSLEIKEGPSLYLVDLPGYGYAKVSQSLVREWTDLLKAYLRGRPSLRRVCLLIDARHGVKESDREIMTMLDKAAVSYQIVLTKSDKLSAVDRDKIIAKTTLAIAKNVAAHPEILLTSSEKGSGIPEMRAVLTKLAVN